MFTGIVEGTGRLESLERRPGAWRLVVGSVGAAGRAGTGESVAVNGCCLTVVGREEDRLHFDLLEETLRLTHFPSLRRGARLNLERSLAVGDRLGGHFVTGHVDGQGEIEVYEPRGADHYLRVRGPAGAGRLLVRKGSVAVDGISLTVAEVSEDAFAAWIIPHTRAVTDLAEKARGDRVNVELDMLGKYVERLLGERSAPEAEGARLT